MINGNQGGGLGLIAWLKLHSARIGEIFWFCICFLLFLVLGPFSSIAVLFGLKSMASEENRRQMTEPAKV